MKKYCLKIAFLFLFISIGFSTPQTIHAQMAGEENGACKAYNTCNSLELMCENSRCIKRVQAVDPQQPAVGEENGACKSAFGGGLTCNNTGLSCNSERICVRNANPAPGQLDQPCTPRPINVQGECDDLQNLYCNPATNTCQLKPEELRQVDDGQACQRATLLQPQGNCRDGSICDPTTNLCRNPNAGKAENESCTPQAYRPQGDCNDGLVCNTVSNKCTQPENLPDVSPEPPPPPPPPPCAAGLANGVCTSFNSAIGVLSTNPEEFITSLFAFLLSISGGIALLLIMRAGYQMMTSQGRPEQLNNARDHLIAAIVGLLFLIFSFVILQIIGFDILRIPGLT